MLDLEKYLIFSVPTSITPTEGKLRASLSSKVVIVELAVVLTLLSFANVMPLMSALDDGRNEAALRAIVMLSSSFYAMVFFIKSFIQARTK